MSALAVTWLEKRRITHIGIGFISGH